MRKLILSLAAATALIAVAPSAQAMTPGTAAGLATALDNAVAIEQAAYVCRHRYYSSRRVCWWRPSYRRAWRRRYW